MLLLMLLIVSQLKLSLLLLLNLEIRHDGLYPKLPVDVGFGSGGVDCGPTSASGNDGEDNWERAARCERYPSNNDNAVLHRQGIFGEAAGESEYLGITGWGKTLGLRRWS